MLCVGAFVADFVAPSGGNGGKDSAAAATSPATAALIFVLGVMLAAL